MAKNFFSGGTMPSEDLLLFFGEQLHLSNMWKVHTPCSRSRLHTYHMLSCSIVEGTPLREDAQRVAQTYGRQHHRGMRKRRRLFLCVMAKS